MKTQGFRLSSMHEIFVHAYPGKTDRCPVQVRRFMFSDLFSRFKKPSPDQFDAYFYDIDGPRKDVSILPEYLKKLVEFPVSGSGTNKFLWIIHQFACRARLAIECGVWEGNVTVPLSMGLQRNNGHLYPSTLICRGLRLRKRWSFGISRISVFSK